MNIQYSCKKCRLIFGVGDLRMGGCPQCCSTSDMYTKTIHVTKKDLATNPSSSENLTKRSISQNLGGGLSDSRSSSQSSMAYDSVDIHVTFGKAIEAAVVSRDELDDLAREAMDCASQAELQKLLTTLDKLSRMCTDMKKNVMERIVEIDMQSRNGPPRPPPGIPPEPRVRTDSGSSVKSASSAHGPFSTNHQTSAQTVPYANPVVGSQQKAFSAAEPVSQSYDPAQNGNAEGYDDSRNLGKITVPCRAEPTVERLKAVAGNGQKYKGVSCIEYTLSQMGKWRVAALGDVGKYLRVLVCFPHMSPTATADALRDYLISLNFQVLHVEMFRWNDGKTRGPAMVTLANPKMAIDLVSSLNLRMADEWALNPKLVMIDWDHLPAKVLDGQVKNGDQPSQLPASSIRSAASDTVIRKEQSDSSSSSVLPLERDLSDPDERAADSRIRGFMADNCIPCLHPFEAVLREQFCHLRAAKFEDEDEDEIASLDWS